MYIDTSWCPNKLVLDPHQVVDTIRAHGVQQTLFATDYPTTTDSASQLEWLKQLPLQDDERQLIFEGNARKLLRTD